MQKILLENGMELELCIRDQCFTGIGSVQMDGTTLRDSRRPAFVQIRTPDGVQLSDFEVIDRTIDPMHVCIELRPLAAPGGQMEWMLHEVRPRINPADWGKSPTVAHSTRLTLDIVPVTRSFGAHTAQGFGYQYQYQSEDHPIYKILDYATWEVSGRATGNELWLRNSFAPSIHRFDSVEEHYSTEWYLPSASNPNIFQFLPWQTTLEGFTLTFHDDGALVTWATAVSHVRSLFEKPRHTDAIFHWHEHCGDLGAGFATAPMEILWIPGDFRGSRTAQFNLYETIREMVYDTLHTEIGMRRERAASYGVIEEWNIPDLVRYREQGLPKLLDAGAKTIFLPNEFENNMNVYGVSNMCCTVDYKVAETVGEDNLRAFCQAALEAGTIVEMWGNTALSTLVPICAHRNGEQQRIDFLPKEGSISEVLATADDPFVRNASGAIEADHYTPMFAQLNLRDPAIWKYWMQQWQKAYDEIGIGGIFLDSSFNMSSDKFHWIANPQSKSGSGGTVDQTHLLGMGRPEQEPPPAILSQYRVYLDLMVEMQKAGYVYCGEDVGVFGIHRSGPGIETRLDNIPMWADSITNFDANLIRSLGADPDDIFFRGLAFRMIWFVYWDVERDELTYRLSGRASTEDAPTKTQIALFHAYNAVRDKMDRWKILPGGKAVLYTAIDGESQVLWAFEDIQLLLSAPHNVQDMVTSDEWNGQEVLSALSRHVYLLTTAKDAC